MDEFQVKQFLQRYIGNMLNALRGAKRKKEEKEVIRDIMVNSFISFSSYTLLAPCRAN
jgi:hypothetical protein